MLEARDAWFTRVLDLYAGTGALGIEALSRGAEQADFIERDRAACALIATNLERTGLQGYARIMQGVLPGALSRVTGPYGLVFIDPPYEAGGVEEVFERLASSGCIDASTTIVYEHSRRTIAPECCGQLARMVTRRHGTTAVTLYGAPAAATLACEGV